MNTVIKHIVTAITAMFPTLFIQAVYYIPPSNDVMFEYAEVYLGFDNVHNSGNALSQRDSVYQYIVQREIEVQKDELGRFAMWRMLPVEIVSPDNIRGSVGRVDITLEIAPISTLQDTVVMQDGNILLPYGVWCKVSVSNADGNIIYSNDYGLLKGTKRVNADSDTEITQSTSIIGVNEAVSAVRADLFGKYGFSTTDKPVDRKQIAGSKYATATNVLNCNIAQFVDYYAYNDLLCQIYELNSPYQFLQADTVDRNLKAVEGVIYRKGEICGTYTIEYKNGRLKSFSGYKYTKDSDGKNVKQRINTITPKYNRKTGEYEQITTFDGQLTKVIFPGYNSTTEWGVKSKQPNFCKTQNLIGGFLKMKEETSESVEMTIDLDGNVYFDCEITSSIPFGLFKMLADSNSVKFPLLTSENHSVFRTKLSYDLNMNIMTKDLTGSILLEKNRGYNNYTYIKADSIKSHTVISGYNKSGVPSKVKRDVSVTIMDNWNIDYKWDLKNFFGKINTKTKVNNSSEDNSCLTVDFSIEWDMSTKYDENGDLVNVKMGNTEIVNTYKR